MRFYRVHYMHEAGTSAGFKFTSSKQEATDLVATWRKNKPGPDDDHDAEINVIDITPTKVGILHGLNAWASHPDNG